MSEQAEHPELTELPGVPGFPGTESGSPADLLDDCRRIASRWATAHLDAAPPVPPSSIHGTKVPAASAHAVEEMSEYGS
ncbi:MULTISPECIES: hypothetical protein [Streptomyces]|uniref:Uncharacterized protein n=1 Tax=Streptomyces silvisoli TaxID=3034235 RepID=A0ABT5ZG30_9ACTN|nr:MULTISPECIES: hypothetical protein [Streptomyces]MDF3288534.1 hypothetical protein [Streptomyces silvisoli]